MNELQGCILNIFREVAKVLDDNGIPYFAIGGTCIGAVRHKGFIPWDDDLDIAIPVEQFGLAIEKLREKLPSKFRVVTGNDIKNFNPFFIKVTDEDTTFIENVLLPDPSAYYGVYVDIMPLGGVPAGRLKRAWYYFVVKYLGAMNWVVRHDYSEMKTLPIKILWRVSHFFAPNKKYDAYYNRTMAFFGKHPVCKEKYAGYVWDKALLTKMLLPVKDFSSALSIPFEDTEMKCPVGYDDYLTQHFGDYMKLPPEDKRTTPHDGVIDLEKSYKEYQKEALK